MADKKRALVVEDHRLALGARVDTLESMGYEVTPVFYFDTREVPTEGFDLAVVDGLNGDGIQVLKDINATRKFLYTGDNELERAAEKEGLEAYSKDIPLDRILGDSQ